MDFAWTNFFILMLISAIHVFWAFGGQWGANASVPKINGDRVLKPGLISTVAVAIAIAGMAAFHLYRVGVISLYLPEWLSASGIWLISGIFFFRAIGDFKYVGFFKSVKDSDFAKMDTRFYSPLCIVIALNALMTGIYDI